MARSSSGANALTSSSPFLNAYPITMACWFNPANLTDLMVLMSINNETIGAGDYIDIVLVGGGNLYVDAGGSTAVGTSTAVASANTWNHACGVFTSASSRTVYLNGGGAATNTNTQAKNTWTESALGGLQSGGILYHLTGSIAEGAVWSAALTANEVKSLAACFSPETVRPSALVEYWKVMGRASPEPGVKGAFPLTITGTMNQADHCRVIRPSHHRARRFTTATGGAFTAKARRTLTARVGSRSVA